MSKRYFTIIVVLTLAALGLIGSLRFLGQKEKTSSSASDSPAPLAAAPAPTPITPPSLMTSVLILPLTSTTEKGWTSLNYNAYDLNPNTVYRWIVQNKLDAMVRYYDITDWAKNTTYRADGSVKYSPSWKQNCLTNLANFRASSTENCPAVAFDTPFDPTYDLVHHTSVNSDFGRGDILGSVATKSGLRGVYYITFSSQSPEYDPTLLVYLTGQINGRQVFLKGQFSLFDNRRKEVMASYKKLGMDKTLALITKYRDDVKVRHQLTPDLQALVNQSLAYFDRPQIIVSPVTEYSK